MSHLLQIFLRRMHLLVVEAIVAVAVVVMAVMVIVLAVAVVVKS